MPILNRDVAFQQELPLGYQREGAEREKIAAAVRPAHPSLSFSLPAFRNDSRSGAEGARFIEDLEQRRRRHACRELDKSLARQVSAVDEQLRSVAQL